MATSDRQLDVGPEGRDGVCETCETMRYPGILPPAGESEMQVMRCDTCRIFGSDYDAARFLQLVEGFRVVEQREESGPDAGACYYFFDGSGRYVSEVRRRLYLSAAEIARRRR